MGKRPLLQKSWLWEQERPSSLAPFSSKLLELPIRVAQFGEGNFLRGFFDWMLQEMNKKGVFEGRAAVVQPIPGRVDPFVSQDCLYTLILRGLEKGETIDRREIITSIGEIYSVSKNWENVLSLARDPLVEYVVSNTTEAGITYRPEDSLSQRPPASYPGKLTAFLYERYQRFQGDREKGMVIIPVELIDRNGDKLKAIVLQLIEDWKLPIGFKEWILASCSFLNTLVDRIVTGYPHGEIEELTEELGYEDSLLVTGEIFHLWVIEGEKSLQERLPFHKAGLQVKWVEDLAPYRTRKVRILNGAHTLTAPIAILSGVASVKEALDNASLSLFIEEAIYQEIIPTITMDRGELEEFAEMVLERFRNPFIEHRWLDISLNSTSKFKTRVLPSLLEYIKRGEGLPKRLLFSFAGLLYLYKGREMKENSLVAGPNHKEYALFDDLDVLKTFLHLWQEVEIGEKSLREFTEEILCREEIWGEDLTLWDGVVDEVVFYLESIEDKGMAKAFHCFIGRSS